MTDVKELKERDLISWIKTESGKSNQRTWLLVNQVTNPKRSNA